MYARRVCGRRGRSGGGAAEAIRGIFRAFCAHPTLLLGTWRSWVRASAACALMRALWADGGVLRSSPQARAMLGEARGAEGWSLAARKHAAETAAAVRQLNAAVVSALCAEGVPAAGVSPLPLGWTARTAAFAYRHALEPLLRAGLTPVVHGDVVLDPEAGDSAGATILSGDVIAARAAEAFAADFCVFLTDVSGVFDRPPRLPGAVRRRRVSAAEARRPVLQPTAVHAHAALSAMGPADLGRRKERGGVVDVTGGMAAKLQWAAEAAGKGADVYICKVGTEAARQALNGTVHRVARETGETPPDWEGTWVVSEGR